MSVKSLLGPGAASGKVKEIWRNEATDVGRAVVKMPWDARERRSCTCDYSQIVFLHLYKFCKKTGAVDGTVVCDQMTTYVQNN